MTELQQGDAVRVRRAGSNDEWCPGAVILISPLCVSVAVELYGAVRAGDGIVMGVLPLLIDRERETVTGLTGDAYEIEKHTP